MTVKQVGRYDQYGDFVMPLDRSNNRNAKGEITLTGDLSGPDPGEPIVLLRMEYKGDGTTETVYLPAHGEIEMRSVTIRAVVILNRAQAEALAESLLHLTRPVEERNE